jgi:DNA polymerase-3 subunit gamma/tau
MHVSLPRKWRPRRFQDLVGQEAVARTLTNAISDNRVAPAYLLTGPRGVGKTSTARLLARALNCEKGPTPDPCGECASCKEILARGDSLDVHEIDGASNRKIENARELIETVRYAPQRDRYRIAIIDEVHMLTTEAFNALLKTLEEPPPHARFILASTELHRIPPTIVSRCQRFSSRWPRSRGSSSGWLGKKGSV